MSVTYYPVPVLVYFHDGDFISGTAMEAGYSGIFANLVTPQQIMVVTVQYRLGVWGWWNKNFLEKADTARGFWDGVTAIQWVYRNILGFGGNPYHVTIGGHGSGACLVAWMANWAQNTKRSMVEGKNGEIIPFSKLGKGVFKVWGFLTLSRE